MIVIILFAQRNSTAHHRRRRARYYIADLLPLLLIEVSYVSIRWKLHHRRLMVFTYNENSFHSPRCLFGHKMYAIKSYIIIQHFEFAFAFVIWCWFDGWHSVTSFASVRLLRLWCFSATLSFFNAFWRKARAPTHAAAPGKIIITHHRSLLLFSMPDAMRHVICYARLKDGTWFK